MESIIKVTDLVKTFGNLNAVNGISFEVGKGEFFGFLGVNGAGKSTTINMLCTLFPSTSGSAEICGYTLGKENNGIRHKIGVVFQGNTLDDRLSIKENLISRAYLYENKSQKVKKNVDEICEILEIKDLLNAKFQDLSGGQKRRCEIARALVHRPEILFLDEPTTGLDPKTKQLVWACIETLRKNFNMTVFLTTHYMEEAAKAQHIAVIDKGHLIADASPFKLKELYAHDKLILEVKDKEHVLSVLKASALSYKVASNSFEVFLPNTLAALSLLNVLEKDILAFEVVQGTMEDAFLNLTRKSNTEVDSDENNSNAYQKKYETLYA